MNEFRFNNEHTSAQVADIANMLRQPRLWIPTQKDYPSHSDWLDKAEGQIASGSKRAMAAYMGGEAVGAVIYQGLTGDPKTLEIRNISITDDARGRYVGSFLLRNAEIEAVQNDFPGIEEILVDTKLNNAQMIAFLESQGYSVKEITDLYGLGAGVDVVMSKIINQ